MGVCMQVERLLCHTASSGSYNSTLASVNLAWNGIEVLVCYCLYCLLLSLLLPNPNLAWSGIEVLPTPTLNFT